MTNQQRYIRAHRLTAEKYRNPYGRSIFSSTDCLLCWHKGCRYCTLKRHHDTPESKGCASFATSRAVLISLYELNISRGTYYAREFPTEDDIKLFTPKQQSLLETALTALLNRADFHDKVADLLETLPSERFTEKGWIEFPEIQHD